MAFEEDVYVMHAILHYKVANGKVGFPTTALDYDSYTKICIIVVTVPYIIRIVFYVI